MLTLADSLFDLSRLVAPGHLGPNIIALLTLTLLEIVLGIDNIVFIAILSSKLPAAQQAKARKTGLGLALITRLLLLTILTLILGLANHEIFTSPALNHTFTGKDLVLMGGGLFLIWKATREIHSKVEGAHEQTKKAPGSFWSVIAQILGIDLVFSVDSIVTAVGMAKELPIMMAAVVISVGIMLLASNTISSFIDKHPTMKMLALSFLLLIGVMLVAESLGQHISKGYIYFAMAFALGVEMLNIVTHRKSTKPTSPAPPPPTPGA
jgi:predicted tellurium resistance membrane protein TerC